jgi:hypothetical protein
MTPQQIKNLELGGAVVASLGLIYLVFGKKTDNSGATNDPTQTAPAGTTFDAQNVADTLKAAMADSGTDESAILDALKYVSPGQFILVTKAFGLQPYNSVYGNQWNFNPFYDLPLLALKMWLKEELSTADYAVLKNKYPSSL